MPKMQNYEKISNLVANESIRLTKDKMKCFKSRTCI